MSKETMTPKTKKTIAICIAIGVWALFLLLYFLWPFGGVKKAVDAFPTLTIETPQKISASGEDEFSLDVTVSSLSDAMYPAASMSIAFDPAYLEFMGVQEGNVLIGNGAGDIAHRLPDWSCNALRCNETGMINIMYLDTTGGKNAFSKEFLKEEKNVVLRLKFRLRGSACAGDVFDLIFEDAVFAASDESRSLAMTNNTLKVRNGKVVIGE